MVDVLIVVSVSSRCKIKEIIDCLIGFGNKKTGLNSPVSFP
jgi:hypothetical protein